MCVCGESSRNPYNPKSEHGSEISAEVGEGRSGGGASVLHQELGELELYCDVLEVPLADGNCSRVPMNTGAQNRRPQTLYRGETPSQRLGMG